MAIKSFLSTNKNKNIVVVVPTEHLKNQWMKELIQYGLFKDVTIEIINSAVKRDDVIDFVILDEVHRVAANLFYELFEKRKPISVLGLSATFNRLDGRHELLNKYCPVCDVITIKDAINNKWLSPYREYKVIIEPDDIQDYMNANKEFINAFSVFDFDFNLAMSCVTNVIKRRMYAKHIKMDHKEMDAIVFIWSRALKARKAYVQQHPKKIEITRRIIEARKGSKIITFSSTIKQAEKIGNGYIVHSGKTKKKNRMTLEEFSNIKSGVIHSAKSLDEGVDIKGLNVAIILSNSSSSIQKTQRIGRIIRYEDGKHAEMFTLVIKGTMEEGWHSTSTSGKQYIEINEQELEEILKGEKSENIEQEGKEVSELFRF